MLSNIFKACTTNILFCFCYSYLWPRSHPSLTTTSPPQLEPHRLQIPALAQMNLTERYNGSLPSSSDPILDEPVCGPTLADLLATVPPLFASCLPPGNRLFEKIKALRLVCREVGSVAMRAVTRCQVQLGGQACLKPEQVVRLMSSAKLESVTVTIITTSGGHLCILFF